jgi:hypothetical protein
VLLDHQNARALASRRRNISLRASWETVGEIVHDEDTFLLCYVRGPEGLIVELAERLDAAPG